jgi:hypothetical protein
MAVIDEREASQPTLWLRLGIGLVQGLIAWMLIEAAKGDFGTDHPQLFAALVMVVAFPPLILLAGLGRMRTPTLVAWTLAAVAALAGLAVYDLWREPLENLAGPRFWPSPQLIFFGGVLVYIAHHLIEPADRERRLHPTYQARFEDAWRHGFQLALSIAFTAVFWGVLYLGAALFDLIGVDVLRDLLKKTWFNCPMTATAFAAAVHLTDVRPGLIRGVRTVGLTLLAWLLPLMTGLTAAFLVALIFTGVEPLWATRRAAQILLSAAAVLIILINAAYQDGQERDLLPRVLRWSGRLAAVLLVPLVGLAAWATALRIGQYGLTTERVVGVAVLVVAALYAAGYAWAAVRRAPWMRRLETINVVAAVAVLAVTLLLLSPVADPSRLAVADQTARLQSGRTPVDKFDFRFLRFNAGRFGREALAGLTRSSNPRIAKAAREMQTETNRYAPEPQAGTAFERAEVRPAGAVLPETFRRQAFTPEEAGGAGCLRGAEACKLYPKDLDGDGVPEVLAAGGGQLNAYALKDSRWRLAGRYEGSQCDGLASALETGAITTAPPRLPDLEIAGQRLPFNAVHECETTPKPAEPPPKATRPGGLWPAFGN